MGFVIYLVILSFVIYLLRSLCPSLVLSFLSYVIRSFFMYVVLPFVRLVFL